MESHIREEPDPTPYPPPIFVLGMRPRSGTHFLANLLCQHPDCVKSAIAEDSLLVNANLLTRYVSKLKAQWEIVNGKPLTGYDKLLSHCIGDGLISFLHEIQSRGEAERVKKFGKQAATRRGPKRLVTKTPLIEHFESFFQFFPRAHLLVLVRDGRAVVESNVRSFGGEPEREMRAWAAAADRLARFEAESNHARARYLIVRFEDLHTRTEAEMRRILAFLGLNPETYSFESALNLPVVGSSTFKRPPGNVRWLPVKKTPDFDPLTRASEWTRATHERFNWLAGKQLVHLSYTQRTYCGNRLAWTIWNEVMDLRWRARRVLRRRVSRLSGAGRESSTSQESVRSVAREPVAPGAG